MKPASALYYNDADWLEQTQTSLVHAQLPANAAKALGCRSLRYHNQVIVCVLHEAALHQTI